MPIGSTYKINGWANEVIGFNGRLTIRSCPSCNVTYALPEEIVLRMRRYSGSYPNNYASTYCPNGHEWRFTGKGTEEELRQRAEDAEAELQLAREQRDRERRAAITLKGQITRIKNRIAAGVCPVCKANLGDRVRDHMGHEHPEFRITELTT